MLTFSLFSRCLCHFLNWFCSRSTLENPGIKVPHSTESTRCGKEYGCDAMIAESQFFLDETTTDQRMLNRQLIG